MRIQNPVLMARINCLNKELSGSISGKLQNELMEFANKRDINCVVSIVCNPTIQYTGDFKGDIYLQIFHDGKSLAVMEKIEELRDRGYLVQTTESDFV